MKNKQVNWLRRRVIHLNPTQILAVGFFIIIIVCTLFIAVCILIVTNKVPFLNALFEVVSTFSTTGLTMNLTPHLTTIGKPIISFMMYFGLIGPLTPFFSLSQWEPSKVQYPSEDILTG